jgi:hypothetical protein
LDDLSKNLRGEINMFEKTWSTLRKMKANKPKGQSNIQRILGLQSNITISVPLHVVRIHDWKFVTIGMILRNDFLAQKFLFGMDINTKEGLND